MRSHVIGILVTVAFCLEDGGSERTVCGDPSDPCMNEENWDRCNEFVEAGCRDLIIMDSCPLQFVCSDESGPKIPDGADRTPHIRRSQAPKPKPVAESCVSLWVYKDEKCQGDPVRAIRFPTWSKEGSPCCKYK